MVITIFFNFKLKTTNFRQPFIINYDYCNIATPPHLITLFTYYIITLEQKEHNNYQHIYIQHNTLGII